MFKINNLFVGMRSILLILSVLVLYTACNTNKRYTYSKRSSSKTIKKRDSKSNRSTKKIVSKKYKLRRDIVRTAKSYKGIKYVYGGKTPSGFDCSGFITYVMQKNGIDINGSSKTLAKKGKTKSKKQLQSGDLVFFGKGSKVSHIALVVENKNGLRVIHSTSSRGVVIDEISSSKYWNKKYLFGKSIL